MADNRLSLIVSFTGNDKLSGAIRNLIGLGRNGDQALKGMFKQANNLKKEMANLDKQIGKTSGNVSPLIDQQKDLAAQLEKVNAQIDRQKALNAFHADTNRIGQRGAALRSAGTDNVLGGAAMAAPLILAGKAAMDFSSGMVDIAQKANLSQDQTNAMAQGILRAAQAAHQMPEAMRQGVDALSGFGIDPREAMQMIGPIGRLGTAMKVDIADGAAAASANLQNLKVGLGDTGKALDIMAAGGNVGAFEVRDMARYFPSLTAQAQALGQSGLGAVADLTAALEIARRGAGTSEEAATNIANLLAKINSPTVTRAFAKNFGVDLPAALKAAYAQGKTPMEALAAITQKATGGDLSKLGLVVEDMQAQSALRTLILNMDDYRKIRADLGKSGGTVQAAFAQREALDASVAWQSFTGTMSALAITLGATLLPSVTQFFGWVNTGVSAIARWAQANPELAGQIMTLASAFIAGRMALGALQFGFGSVLSGLATLRNGFMMVRAAFAVLAPIIGAIGLWPIVIGAVFAALAYVIYSHWGAITGFFQRTWASIKAVWDGAPAWMRAIGGMMMDGLLNALIPGRLASRLLEIAQAGMTAFRNYFGIKSPSRLMMEMGGHITTGLGQGITGGTAQPLRAMGQMARRVAGAGALSLAGPSLAPSAMPGFARTGPQGASARAAPAAPITINIHQQPGEDAEALARRVMQLIDREKRASGRFADDFDT
ncbi:phage tail tape measure protein [Novosphingobium pituita]|uniref:Phage tail tape measure protein domain-containing protein n=1 Tax=Novosphingobium pituita TaxID=3056842 RepID=A0ABQ6P5R4_9SPHN|nr:phage tail tape measure protein [Novosphingobium sp. IK01]GMM59899.1 hypothetical protein NUTIK01_06760 [Novosphingobium sp. IK01]